MAKTSRQRIPKLRFTSIRGIGWHVAYRDPITRHSKRHRFGIEEREREPVARTLYHAWLVQHLGGVSNRGETTNVKPRATRTSITNTLSGSILEIASGLIEVERARTRSEKEPRRRGTIAAPVFRDRNKQIRDFLQFLNERHGAGAVSRMRLVDLSMDNVELYNQILVEQGYSDSQVAKRVQLVKAIIDRAGRPEHGRQLLTWNWDSRDVAHGAPTNERKLPSVKHLNKLLDAADLRGRTMIWLGIGMGLGARDLAAIHVGQIAEDAYDLRRSKTGVERYGTTPPLVWAYVSKYKVTMSRPLGELLFVTRTGVPLVHSRGNAVTLWWSKLRVKAGETKATVPGFYTLRHLGATEFGSRPRTSISEVKRWLGHSASSDMSDVYMRPVKPEYREVIEWVRARLASTALDG